MRALDWWKKVYPITESGELSEAGHFLQEDTSEKDSHNNHRLSPQESIEPSKLPFVSTSDGDIFRKPNSLLGL
jgi:hypothetical protein